MFLSSDEPGILGASLTTLSFIQSGVNLCIQRVVMCAKISLRVGVDHPLTILAVASDGPGALPALI